MTHNRSSSHPCCTPRKGLTQPSMALDLVSLATRAFEQKYEDAAAMKGRGIGTQLYVPLDMTQNEAQQLEHSREVQDFAQQQMWRPIGLSMRISQNHLQHRHQRLTRPRSFENLLARNSNAWDLHDTSPELECDYDDDNDCNSSSHSSANTIMEEILGLRICCSDNEDSEEELMEDDDGFILQQLPSSSRARHAGGLPLRPRLQQQARFLAPGAQAKPSSHGPF